VLKGVRSDFGATEQIEAEPRTTQPQRVSPAH